MIAKNYSIDSRKALIMSFGITIAVFFVGWMSYKFIASKSTSNPSTFSNNNLVSQTTPSPTQETSLPNNIIVPSAEIDSDQDGLSDAMEVLYKTDSNNNDTDGDGYQDGAEIANGYDPLIKSPNDKIDRLSFLPTSPVTSASPSSITLTPNNPSAIAPILNGDDAQLNKFINEANARGILPIIMDSDIKISTETGKQAIVKYLDALSVKTNTAIKAVTPEDIITAFNALTNKKDPVPLNTVIANLKGNTQIFRDVMVPKEVVELHKKYLGAVLALQNNTETFKNYQTDYASVLVAASRIEGLRGVFAEVGNEIKVVEKKYDIK
jgi:hypothetical protein